MNNKLSDPVVIEAWQEARRREVKTKPWLASLLLQKGNPLLARFAAFYAQLTAVNQQTRRHLALGIGSSALLLALSGTPAPALHASGIIHVDGTTCTLASAITAANTDTAVGGCPAGNGADVLNLTTSINLTAPLPSLSTPISINGNGHSIQRTGGADFRILHVASTGHLTLNNTTLSGGRASGAFPSNAGRVNPNHHHQ
jgi:hypothetical protein